MLNGRRKWREKTGNDAENGIFIIKSDFYAILMRRERTSLIGVLSEMVYDCSTGALDTETAPELALEVTFSGVFFTFFNWRFLFNTV